MQHHEHANIVTDEECEYEIHTGLAVAVPDRAKTLKKLENTTQLQKPYPYSPDRPRRSNAKVRLHLTKDTDNNQSPKNAFRFELDT